jgi:hypothetical protein
MSLNGDAAIDLSDVIYMVSYLFLQGPEPVFGLDGRLIVGCPEVCQGASL